MPKTLQSKKLNLENILIHRSKFCNPNKTTPILLGYFCKHIQEALILKNPELKESEMKTLHICLIDCWLTIFYKLIWIPRAETSKKSKTKRQTEKRKAKRKRQQEKIAKVSQEFQEDIPPESPPKPPTFLSTPEITTNNKRKNFFTPTNKLKKLNQYDTPRNKRRILSLTPSPQIKSIIFPRNHHITKKSRLSENIENNNRTIEATDDNPFYSSPPQSSQNNQRFTKPNNNFYDRL